MSFHWSQGRAWAAAAAAVLVLVIFAYVVGRPGGGDGPSGLVARAATDPRQGPAASQAGSALNRDSVALSDAQLTSVKVEPIEEHEFPTETRSIGNIAFNEDQAVQVFTPYPGRIIGLFAKTGDDVKKGQTLFTIDSPDLLQAESTLIAAAGVLELTNKNLVRLKSLYTTKAVSQRELEQGASDQQTAEGSLRAARDAVRLFGKTDVEIDHIVAQRMADPTLVVPSPITGRVTQRNAAPGLYVQPANAPAPFAVADIDSMWMLANVPEAESTALRVGQDVAVTVNALPGRVFSGTVATVGEMVDPNTRRVLVRSVIANADRELKSGMFANFVIRTGEPVRSPAVPPSGVVREGDGTMTVWITADRRRFTRRVVKIGQEHNGYRQILEGVQPGELVATEGALFLSQALATAVR